MTTQETTQEVQEIWQTLEQTARKVLPEATPSEIHQVTAEWMDKVLNRKK